MNNYQYIGLTKSKQEVWYDGHQYRIKQDGDLVFISHIDFVRQFDFTTTNKDNETPTRELVGQPSKLEFVVKEKGKGYYRML